MSNGFCVFEDGPYEYYDEFRKTVEIACPTNTDLHILLKQPLKSTHLSDMNICFVWNQLEKARKEVLSDKDILQLQLSGEYIAVISELRCRVAIHEALNLLNLGSAYGPLRSKTN